MAAALHRHDPGFVDATVGSTRDVYRGLDDAGFWLSQARGPVTLLRADPAVFGLPDDWDATLVREHARDGHVQMFPGIGHGLRNFTPQVVADALAELIAA